MSTDDTIERAVDVLQQLGLREYEARCFVGLTRLSAGTAKEISEVTDVPRTRVYDATRVLASEGLVEIQHSNPQRFRAVPLGEAAGILQDRYEDRVERLTNMLGEIERIDADPEEATNEVWAMTGREAIAARTRRLVENADQDIVFVVGDSSLVTDELIASLQSVAGGVDVLIGAVTEPLREQIAGAVPGATTFVSGLDWLQADADREPAVGRLLLVDRSTILVSTVSAGTGKERAVYGSGFENGMVVIVRRLMAQGVSDTLDG